MGETEDPLAINGDVQHSLELRAIVQLARGEIEASLRLLQVAVAHAARNHPGWFVSPTIERALLRIGSLDHFRGDPAPNDPAEGRIVHVVAGSATQTLDRSKVWWEGDDTARVVALADSTTEISEAARQLRSDLEGAALVVLHGAGVAVAPIVALAGWRERPPVVMIEPEPTAFWAGIAIADVVVHSSNASMALAVERRCVARERGVLVERHERRDADALTELLQTCGQHARRLGRPLMPHALLPAAPNATDRWTLAQQLERGSADGLDAALARWPLPDALRRQLGWVLLASDARLATATLHTMLDVLPDEFPDIVVVNVTADPEVDGLAPDLAGVAQVVSPGRAITDEVGAAMAKRFLVMDEVLVFSDGLAPLGHDVDEFDLRRFSPSLLAAMRSHVASDAAAVSIDGLPPGETLELVVQRAPERLRRTIVDVEGTHVRDDVVVTETHADAPLAKITTPFGS